MGKNGERWGKMGKDGEEWESALPECSNFASVKASEPRYGTLDPFRRQFLPVPQSSTTRSAVSLGGKVTHLRPQSDLPSGGRNVPDDPKVTYSVASDPRQNFNV